MSIIYYLFVGYNFNCLVLSFNSESEREEVIVNLRALLGSQNFTYKIANIERK